CSGLTIGYNNIGVNANGAGAASFGNANNGIVFTSGTVNNLNIVGNTISRSTNIGIYMLSLNANPMTIQNNNIGSNSTGLYDGTDYGNGHGGIVFTGGTMSNITVSGNVILRNGWSTQDNNSCGIYVVAGVTTISISNNKIGVYADNSFTPPAGGYSGNAFAGIFFNSSSSAITISNNVIGRNGFGSTKSHGIATAGTISNITISNNYVGITPASVAIGNGNSGMDLQNVTTGTVSNNFVGSNEGRRTDIPAAGIALSNGTNHVSITGNMIGLAPNGSAAGQQLNGSYDGSAIRAEGSGATKQILINNNTLAYSAGNGVDVIAGADYVQIFDNSIYCNTLKGINLNCGGSAPNGPGNNSFGCGSITLNTFVPIPTDVNGGRPANATVYVYGTNACSSGSCTGNPQGQTRFTAATTTYPTGATWDYNNGSLMYNDITALAVGTGGDCSGAYCRTSEFSPCVNNTLPVSLLYFKVQAQTNGTVSLSWMTTTEKNNAYFVIERSQDGITFEPIGTVEGHGNSIQSISYSYTDYNALDGTSYYRLKQVDFNGQAAYSDIKSVSFNANSFIKVYPNPSNGSFKISVLYEGDYEITITNILGQTVYSTSISSASMADNAIQTGLSKGTYFLSINATNIKYVSKVVIE
ncbi:MAG TPA: T9SS type A sorting domain-containing protein, partial [Cytophagaceae bacterium]|nr:T9SS type A sorting domain-containing protein [Cytophagaceae bacterium]